ncbi:protein co-occurring with transport system [Fulvivirga imtechensis AK7]|uniref:Protein co-occurring with transport system n=1 Tax=Fulvivirga imtechensis AK7 TaxID=1237149 RepID=L8JNK0_9BACT|nr:YigZ family protein [Fulvivirga imtechensis]ELR69109.1 protein co-occurring with transport system [Fulvivirga imtechensis AK7]
MIESYLTISSASEGFYKEKGSKFLAFAFPVATEDEVRERLEDLRKRYHDARHHCYAYILGAEKGSVRANDDGEPNHSAGDPILGQINSKHLTNVLVVVVRYFGGTKLGVSGLINAYKVSAEDALNNATIEKVYLTHCIRVDYPYESTNEVMRLINDFEIRVKDQVFEVACILKGEVKVTLVQALKEKVQLLKDTGHKLELLVE